MNRALRSMESQHGLNSPDDLPPDPGGWEGSGGDDSSPPASPAAVYPDGSLWVEPVSVVSNRFNALLHGATSGSNFLIISTGELNPPTNSTWQVEGSLQGGTNDATPFALGVATRTNNVFVRAQACDECATTALPLSWQLAYFGATGVNPSSDYDGDGTNNLAEYLNGTDPNTISFLIAMGNQYANADSLPVPLIVTGGVPTSMAVLVDNTNLAGATWTNYNPIATANLGTNEGWHRIWIGLRGRTEISQQTWQTTRVKLDTKPPVLTITNPVSPTVDCPVVQLQGYCSEALAVLSYDLTNAAGLVTNQSALVVHQFYDTNTLEFTTNYFQCFDVSLTNGANTITLYATDLTGNTTITNFTYTLDYSCKTNPPVISLGWPQDGTQISGSSFAWRGWISDPSAQVTAQIVDTNGVTNIVSGIVQRDGSFRVENLPLTGGSNAATLMVMDAAGNPAVANITTIQSDLALTIDDVSWEWAYGTISDMNYDVWVNGVQADVYDYGFGGMWSANLQLDLDNTGVQARAIPKADDMLSSMRMSGPAQEATGGGSAASASMSNPASPQAVDVETVFEVPSGLTYVESWNEVTHYAGPMTDPQISQYDYTCHWEERSGGSGTWYATGNPYPWSYYMKWDNYLFFPGRYPDCGDGVSLSGSDGTTNGEASAWVPTDLWNYCDDSYTAPGGSIDWRQTSGGDVAFVTGGAPNETGEGLFLLTASVFEGIPAAPDRLPSSGYFFPPEQVTLGAVGKLDTDGYLAANLPLHSQVPCTPRVRANQYQGIVQGQRLKLVSYCLATYPANTTRTTIGVGEQVSISFNATLPVTPTWTASAGSIDTNRAPAITFTAPSYATNVTITGDVKGKKESIKFTVLQPTGFHHAVIVATNNIPGLTNLNLGDAGAQMRLNVWIAPTNVSFYQVFIMEVGQDATNISGYFAQWTPQELHHDPNGWAHLTQTNTFYDRCAGAEPSPWSPGMFMWPIPARWKVTESGTTNSMTGWEQFFSIDGSGTEQITKYNHWVERSTNGVIVTH